MATDREALLLQISADVRGLEKQFAKASGIVDKGSRSMERRAKVANDNVSKSLGNVKTATLQQLAPGVDRYATALSGLGAAGIAAGVGIAAVVSAVSQASAAMAFGDELQAVADKIQITAEALQELQFVADETDVPIEALHEGLQKLTGSIGAFKTGIGGKKVASAFAALGIDKAALKDVHNATDLLPILADRLGKISDTASQVQIAKKLGIENLLPMLRQGSAGIEEMTARARELGLVLSNETVKGLADADRQMELATKQIQSSLRVAFSGLATDIAGVVTSLAQFLVKLRQSQEGWAVFARAVGSSLKNAAIDSIPGGRAARLGMDQAKSQAGGKQLVADIKDALSKPLPTAAAAAGFTPTFSGGGGGSSRAAKGKDQTFTPVEAVTLDDAWGEIDQAEAVRARWLGMAEAVKTFSDNGLIPTAEAMAQLGKDLEAAANSASELGESVHDAFENGIRTALLGGDLGDIFDAVFSTLAADAASSLAATLSDVLMGLFKGASGGGLGGIGGFLGSLFSGPAHAAGTDFAPGGLSLVGERGAELVNLPRGAQVIPNDILRGMTKAGGQGAGSNLSQTLHVTVQGGGMSAADARRTGSQVGAAAMRELAKARRSGF